MTAAEIIRRKRDGKPNSDEEIRFLVRGATSRQIPHYQLSAWLMAVFLRGMSETETMALTQAFVDSGVVVDFASIAAPKVDKHSTGGVGDKTSFLVAPIAAAAGVAVPMISGRGLGHTGGTLDKLESIPGLRTDLSLSEFRTVVERCGLSLIGATDELAPADRLFYSLRDVTSTVESVPLIVASILSKKVAEGIDGLVLDVKTGCGAFMEKFEDSCHLAERLVDAGRRLGKSVVALVTDMSQPLGRKVGNALEVEESIDCLKGLGPADLTDVSLELAARMILLGGVASSLSESQTIARRQLESGRALEKFAEMIEAQGGDPSVVKDTSLLARSGRTVDYLADQSGSLGAVRAGVLGRVAMALGAGRKRAEDSVNLGVGLVLHHKVGARVSQGEALATLHYEDQDSLKEALRLMPVAYRILPGETEPPQLIQKVIG